MRRLLVALLLCLLPVALFAQSLTVTASNHLTNPFTNPTNGVHTVEGIITHTVIYTYDSTYAGGGIIGTGDIFERFPLAKYQEVHAWVGWDTQTGDSLHLVAEGDSIHSQFRTTFDDQTWKYLTGADVDTTLSDSTVVCQVYLSRATSASTKEFGRFLANRMSYTATVDSVETGVVTDTVVIRYRYGITAW